MIEDGELRDFYAEYVKHENRLGDFSVDEAGQKQIVSVMEYFGPESYRPIAKLLLQNWTVIKARIGEMPSEKKRCVQEIADQCPLDYEAVASLIEVLEGEDTEAQKIKVELFRDGEETE